jgi:hypothetical protein
VDVGATAYSNQALPTPAVPLGQVIHAVLVDAVHVQSGVEAVT